MFSNLHNKCVYLNNLKNIYSYLEMPIKVIEIKFKNKPLAFCTTA